MKHILKHILLFIMILNILAQRSNLGTEQEISNEFQNSLNIKNYGGIDALLNRWAQLFVRILGLDVRIVSSVLGCFFR